MLRTPTRPVSASLSGRPADVPHHLAPLPARSSPPAGPPARPHRSGPAWSASSPSRSPRRVMSSPAMTDKAAAASMFADADEPDYDMLAGEAAFIAASEALTPPPADSLPFVRRAGRDQRGRVLRRLRRRRDRSDDQGRERPGRSGLSRLLSRPQPPDDGPGAGPKRAARPFGDAIGTAPLIHKGASPWPAH